MLVQGIYGELTSQQARASERMQRNSYRLLALLEDFMTYVKAETGGFPLNNSSFEPRILLDTLHEQMAPLAESKGLALHWAVADDLPQKLVGDPTAISRIVQALLWNAIGFTEAGTVEVDSTWTADHQWATIVRDSGPGIASEEQPNIFKPFYRGEQRPPMPSSGFGLGLAMASSLARLMHGQVVLEQSSLQGSTFCLRLSLPVHDETDVTQQPQR